jgi:hypothetical protein
MNRHIKNSLHFLYYIQFIVVVYFHCLREITNFQIFFTSHQPCCSRTILPHLNVTAFFFGVINSSTEVLEIEFRLVVLGGVKDIAPYLS